MGEMGGFIWGKENVRIIEGEKNGGLLFVEMYRFYFIELCAFLRFFFFFFLNPFRLSPLFGKSHPCNKTHLIVLRALFKRKAPPFFLLSFFWQLFCPFFGLRKCVLLLEKKTPIIGRAPVLKSRGMRRSV